MIPDRFSLQAQLEKLNPDAQWKVKSRVNVMEFYGQTDEASLSRILQAKKTISPVGDQFCAEVIIGDIRMTLFQTIQNTRPVTNEQYLGLNFGSTKDAKNSVSPHWGDQKLAFTPYPDGRVTMNFINVPHGKEREVWGRDDEITEEGNDLITCLVEQREKLLQISGLSAADHTLLKNTLEKVIDASTKKRIKAAYWSA